MTIIIFYFKHKLGKAVEYSRLSKCKKDSVACFRFSAYPNSTHIDLFDWPLIYDVLYWVARSFGLP